MESDVLQSVGLQSWTRLNDRKTTIFLKCPLVSISSMFLCLVFISEKIPKCCLILDCVWVFLHLLSCGCLSSGLFCFWCKFLFHGLCVCTVLGDSFPLPCGHILGFASVAVVATMVLSWDSSVGRGEAVPGELSVLQSASVFPRHTNALLCGPLWITCWGLPSTWTSSFLYPRASSCSGCYSQLVTSVAGSAFPERPFGWVCVKP